MACVLLYLRHRSRRICTSAQPKLLAVSVVLHHPLYSQYKDVYLFVWCVRHADPPIQPPKEPHRAVRSSLRCIAPFAVCHCRCSQQSCCGRQQKTRVVCMSVPLAALMSVSDTPTVMPQGESEEQQINLKSPWCTSQKSSLVRLP
jgi:hypothetical protein